MSKTKKVVKKVVKKAVKKSKEQIEFEKFEKAQAEFSKRMNAFSDDLDKLAKTHKVKILCQGYDVKESQEFVTGGNIKTRLEREAMESFLKKTF